jgi:hypothetical protein
VTSLQRSVLTLVQNATKRGEWYRADGRGQRVTLASLYRKGLIDRRARRGKEGDADAAYEYRTSTGGLGR